MNSNIALRAWARVGHALHMNAECGFEGGEEALGDGSCPSTDPAGDRGLGAHAVGVEQIGLNTVEAYLRDRGLNAISGPGVGPAMTGWPCVERRRPSSVRMWSAMAQLDDAPRGDVDHRGQCRANAFPRCGCR